MSKTDGAGDSSYLSPEAERLQPLAPIAGLDEEN
jgi:hypothetical protein